MEFKELAAKRYSVRQFDEKPVEQEKIDMILESARIAPTAANRQPQKIKVITSEEELKKVDVCTPCRFKAPLVFLVCYDKSECWGRTFDSATSGTVDASIIITHMMLQAEDLGIGTTWVMHFDPKKAVEEFNLPENYIPISFLVAGYPAVDAVPAPGHSIRKKIEEILFL
ncbi:MAG: nitroreductase family protein [Clostridiales bacterium]|jgi:nitroreductase|nr:nitroreductase family protein [Clostridiales bacterium]